MTSWIIVLAVVALVVRAVRRHRPTGPELPRGYDRERQLAEWRAMTAANTHGILLP